MSFAHGYSSFETLHVKILRPDAKVPTRATPRSAGLDLYAWIVDDSAFSPGSVIVPSRGQTTVLTGVAVKIPAGHVGLCCPRSGLARNFGITVLNAPGVIDEDYTGEMAVILVNHRLGDYHVKHGERIAQLVIVPVAYASIEIVTELPVTERGASGFGSSGK